MPGKLDLTGHVYGRLTVIAPAGRNAGNKPQYSCVCSCGNQYVAVGERLRSGNTKSCGCLRVEQARQNSPMVVTHGMSNTPEYYAWAAMKARCQNPLNEAYADYGMRGIQVCSRWDSFENFFTDMGYRPTPDHSLDRENNEGNYEPGNCRWATYLEQNNNRRSSRPVELDGRTFPSLAELARFYGINCSTLESRLTRQGMPLEQAVSETIGVEKYFEYDGLRLTLGDWSKKTRIPYQTLYARIHQHSWPLQRAFSEGVTVA